MTSKRCRFVQGVSEKWKIQHFYYYAFPLCRLKLAGDKQSRMYISLAVDHKAGPQNRIRFRFFRGFSTGFPLKIRGLDFKFGWNLFWELILFMINSYYSAILFVALEFVRIISIITTEILMVWLPWQHLRSTLRKIRWKKTNKIFWFGVRSGCRLWEHTHNCFGIPCTPKCIW